MTDFEKDPQDEFQNQDAEYEMEDGVEYEYVEEEEGAEGNEDGVEYEYVDGEEYVDEDLPDGMTVVSEESVEETESDDSEYAEEEIEEDVEGENADKPKSFFAKLGEAMPYEVMIALSFIILVIGILLMLIHWMSYDMQTYPKYPS